MRTMGKLRLPYYMVAMVFGVISMSMGIARSAGTNPTVEVVDVDGTIDAGMAHRVEQAITDAKTIGAHAILLRIATDGGAVDDANSIKDALEGAGIETIAYVPGNAWSAGA